ncbi:hypothetical protein AAE478_004615 [Parahypoxylon ruwenzoriense]
MAPPLNKTNFKTYEASTRLLAAVIATNKGRIKLDFKELAAMMGGGTTGSAVDHRLRPVKQLAKMQHVLREKGEDPGELPVDTGEIQKLFGESTAGGIEWQFRDIKALGRAQQAAVQKGENPAGVKVAGAGGTPSRSRATASTSATPGSRASKAKGTGSSFSTPSAAAGKRKRGKKISMSESDQDDVEDDSDYDAKDLDLDTEVEPTPTRSGKRARTTNDSTEDSQSSLTSVSSKTSVPPVKKSGNGVARSLFGNGITSASAEDNEIHVIDDDDDDDEVQETVTPRPARGRSSIKREPEAGPEDDHTGHAALQSDHDPFVGSDGFYGDDNSLADGEI